MLVVIEGRIPLLTIGSAARLLDIGRERIHDAVINSRLRHVRVGNRRMIDPRDLVEWTRKEGIEVVGADHVAR
jgi:excisionase family DNA binding protein